MATSIGKAFLEVIADFSDVDKKIPETESKLDRLGSSMSKFGALGVAATGAAAIGLSRFGSLAADQNAAVSALNQVLGDAAGAVEDWADESVRAVGLSKRAALEAATQFGGIAKAAGLTADEVSRFAIEQTQLSADLAAFKNVSPEKALQDLQSGYAGSTEVLRQYNIYLDDASLKQAYFRETGEQVTGTLTAQQRIIATHSEIMRQSTDMQGQWNREIGEAPAQQAMMKASLEELQASIGQGVLPVMTDLLEGANKVIGSFNDLDDGTQRAIGTFGTYAAAGVAVISTLSFIGGQAIKLRDRFTTLSADGSRSLNRLGTAAGVAGAAGGMFALAGAIDQAVNKSYNLGKAIEDLSETADDELVESLRNTIKETSGVVSEQELLELVAKNNIGTAERLADMFDEQGISSGNLRKIIAEQTDAQRQANADSARAADIIEDDLEPATENMRRKNLEFTTSIDDVTAALSDQVNELFGVETATSDYEAAVGTLGEALKANGPTLDLTSEKGRDNAQAFRDVVTATGELIAKQAEEGASSAEVQATLDAQKTKLGELATQYGIPIEQVQTYITALDNIPALKSTQLTLDIRAHVERIANAIDYDVTGGSAVEQRAGGGPVNAGQSYWVGENFRRELFVPSVSGHIYNDAQLRDGGFGAKHFHLSTYTQDTTADIQEQFRRMELVAGYTG